MRWSASDVVLVLGLSWDRTKQGKAKEANSSRIRVVIVFGGVGSLPKHGGIKNWKHSIGRNERAVEFL